MILHVPDGGVGSAGLGDSPHVPLSHPIIHNVRGAIVDALSFSDLAEEAALGCVVDLELVDGGVPHLVLVEEAGVFGQGRLVSLILEDVVLMTPGGPVVPRPTLKFQFQDPQTKYSVD